MSSVSKLVQLQFTPEQAKEIAAQGGWCDIDEEWTNPQAFTAPTRYLVAATSNATTRFQSGDKVRLTQDGAVKYFYITSVSATGILLIAGSDYALTANAISAISISRAERPFGFPVRFTFTPSPITSGVSLPGGATIASGPAYLLWSYFMRGGVVCAFFNMRALVIATANAAYINLALPVPVGTNEDGYADIRQGLSIADQGGPQVGPYVQIGSATALWLFKAYNYPAWGTGVAIYHQGYVEYLA